MDSSQSETTQVIKTDAYLVVHSFSTQCGVCNYGGTTWADSPANENKPILRPESRECPDCGVKFTRVRTECMYKIGKPEVDLPIAEWNNDE